MSEVYVGQILMSGFNFAPKNFAFCDGQLLPINQYQALFSLLGTQYGGNGTSTFALPDLRGRVPLGADGTYTQGRAGGTSGVTLNSAQLPPHNHGFVGTSATGTSRAPTNGLYASALVEPVYTASSGPQVQMASQTISPTGDSQPHDNMQPSLAINFSIALTGIFPSRS